MPVVVAVEPVVGLPGVVGIADRGGCLGEPATAVDRFEYRDVDAGFQDQLPERQVGVAAGELPVSRERVHPHCAGVCVVWGIVVDLLADRAAEEVLAAPWFRDVLRQFTAPGNWMHVGVDTTNGDVFGGCRALSG
jgi:hypothetical protein